MREPPITRAWVIAGPTSVGKTGLALALAEQTGGEIIGADAFQVYRGLDRLTAKPTPAERRRVPHHLVDTVPLTHPYDVAQWLTAARACLEEIQARGRQPIFVGGTGLYLRALLRGLADLPRGDETLRAELAGLSLRALQAELRERDPECARTIDLQNPRRLIRALEVCRLTGQPFSSFRQEWTHDAPSDFTGITLTRDRANLYHRIDERVAAMFAEGVVEEVAALGEIGPTAGQVLGLREIRELRSGRLSQAACLAAVQQATRRYAKRQQTWLAREPALVPLEADQPDLVTRALALLRRQEQASSPHSRPLP